MRLILTIVLAGAVAQVSFFNRQGQHHLIKVAVNQCITVLAGHHTERQRLRNRLPTTELLQRSIQLHYHVAVYQDEFDVVL
jgi:hypothetical protein